MKENLELRMYGLVPYNISPIQQGIQFGHAVVEYGQVYGNTPEYKQWSATDKTFIILNGGTTNLNLENLGSLNKHLLDITTNSDISVSPFHEPDLGDQLTAFVFLVDERVFNRDEFPDFNIWLEDIIEPEIIKTKKRRVKSKGIEFKIEEVFKFEYKEWLQLIGGQRNAFLKEFLKPLRKA
jgi:hypothetical protein